MKTPSPPSGAATYERARRLANLAVWTIKLQRRRLRTAEPEDGEFLFRRWSDFQFLIVALARLRRAATLAASVPPIATAMAEALKMFDEALPWLRVMRNVGEHIDEYAVDAEKRHHKQIRRGMLEVGFISETTFRWLGDDTEGKEQQYELNTDEAVAAAQHLFDTIRGLAAAIPSQRARRDASV